MKTPITAVKCRITTTWWNEGSVLRGDYRTGIESLHTDLEIESDSPSADVARLIEMSERACYVLSALDRWVEQKTPPDRIRVVQSSHVESTSVNSASRFSGPGSMS